MGLYLREIKGKIYLRCFNCGEEYFVQKHIYLRQGSCFCCSKCFGEFRTKRKLFRSQFYDSESKQRYERTEFQGKGNLQFHRLVYEYFKREKIPEGFIVHHIDGNKKNNRIENLKCMTHLEHNGIHCGGRKSWSKGVTIKNSEKMRNIIIKATNTKKEKHIKISKETFKMKQSGMRVKKIAEHYGISETQVYARIKFIKDNNYDMRRMQTRS